jgi:glycosyltransferase involved in cell wall biosynthesis
MVLRGLFMLPVSILIPAYNPDAKLLTLVEELTSFKFAQIVVVNDGSKESQRYIFNTLDKTDNIVVLEHAIRLGKGAALKTGLNYIYTKFPGLVGVVTADADGQHRPEDIYKVAVTLINDPNKLVIGVRKFGKKVPARSKIGNKITSKLFRVMTGQKLSDTQSGLRGIARNMILKLLTIRSNGYEFELEVLLLCKYERIQIVEKPITTVYIRKNISSHFNPIIDSLKIYFELFRSLILSFLTAVLDNVVFFISINLGAGILGSQILARCCAVLFNYPLAKKWVFFSNIEDKLAFPKYLLLVVISGALSYGVIHYLIDMLSVNVFAAKIIAESIIYLGNFAVQRDFIFTHKIVYQK